jgi:hypothetical protein
MSGIPFESFGPNITHRQRRAISYCSLFGLEDSRTVQIWPKPHSKWATAGDEAAKQRYAKLIKGSCEVLPNIIVWDAIDCLFPHVDDLLGILSTVE